MSADHCKWSLTVAARIIPGRPATVTVQGTNDLYGELPAIDLFLEWTPGMTAAVAERFALQQLAEMSDALAVEARRRLAARSM